MEDALVLLNFKAAKNTDLWVLILVLMEDALVQRHTSVIVVVTISLNPCFNGRCTRTRRKHPFSFGLWSLNPCFNGRCTRTQQLPIECGDGTKVVLILVLMEDALVRHKGYGFRQGEKSLNPCFNGRCTRTFC